MLIFRIMAKPQDYPRCSMVLEYLLTFTQKIAQMKVNIPAPGSIWGIPHLLP